MLVKKIVSSKFFLFSGDQLKNCRGFKNHRWSICKAWETPIREIPIREIEELEETTDFELKINWDKIILLKL